MSSSSHRRRPRSVSPASSHHSYHYSDHYSEHSHHHGHRKHRKHHESPFAMDLLKTAVSAIGEAVVTGREDGQHHQRKHHYDDYESRSIVAADSKTADQVYDTLLQAAYTLGEVVGELERKLHITPDDESDERRSKTERHRSRSIEGAEGHELWDHQDAKGYDSGYDVEYEYGKTGMAAPPPGGVKYYREAYYSTGRDVPRPYPLRRASSNPEFEFEPELPHSDDRHRSQSGSSHKRSKSNSHHERSRPSSSSGSTSKVEKKKKKKKKKTPEDMILHSLPGLITRAAFILEVIELNQRHREGTGMAAKYAALMIALKIVRQLRREYRWMNEKWEAREEKGE